MSVRSPLEAPAEPARNRAGLGARLLRSAWPPIALAVVPMLVGVGYLIRYRGDWSLFGDGAYLELHVREIGVHPVLVGPFSRYGWSHPGPAIYAVLAPFYRVAGSSSRALAIGALVLNAACVVGIALLVRRRLGHAAMLATLVVVDLHLLVLGSDELRNSWNPYLPILPFALAVLLCWSLVEGDRWALPGAVLAGSFAVQCHIGYALPVAAVAVATAVLLLLPIAVRRWPGRPVASVSAGPPAASASVPARRRGLPVLVAVVGLVLIWLPPLIEQFTRSPGNITAVVRYFRSTRPTATWGQGWRWMAGDLGALPARLTGHELSVGPAGVPQGPGWAAVLAVVLFAAALVVGGRSPGPVRSLGVLTATTAVIGVVAVSRIVGAPYDYLAAWTLVAGLLLWTVVGAVATSLLVDLISRRSTGRSGAPTGAVARTGTAAGALAALVALAVVVVPLSRPQWRPDTAWTYTDGVTPSLRDSVVRWLGPDAGTVAVSAAPRSATEFFAVQNRTAGLYLALVKSGVDAQLPDGWRGAVGDHYVDRFGAARRSLSVATLGGTPPLGQHEVARAGTFVVYGSG